MDSLKVPQKGPKKKVTKTKSPKVVELEQKMEPTKEVEEDSELDERFDHQIFQLIRAKKE